MDLILAASGADKSRLDAVAPMVRARGGSWVELSKESDPVRIGVSAAAGSSTTRWARCGEVIIAVHGSAAADPRAMFTDWRRDPATALDGATDAVALVADLGSGVMWSLTGAGNHRLYSHTRTGHVVGTHLATVAAALGEDLQVDRSYEDFLLGFGFLPDGRTPYRDVTALSPSTAMSTGEDHVDLRSSVRALPDVAGLDESSIRVLLHDTFMEVLDEQTRGATSHAVLLGGLDSALVVVGLRRLGHDVHTYTFSFDDVRYDQRHAARIAADLGAQHTLVPFDSELIGDLLSRMDQLLSSPSSQPHYQLHTIHAASVIAADGHERIFTGDGCDAVFLGYPTVSQRARVVGRMGSIPRPMRRSISAALGLRGVERRLGHVARLGRSSLEAQDLGPPARGHLPTRYIDDVLLNRLRVERPPQAESIAAIRRRLASGLEHLDPTRLAFHGGGLTGQSRAKVEGAVATSGLPQHSPFTHPRLKGLVGSLPVEMLRSSTGSADDPGKAILIEMVREQGLLPDYIINMPKQSPSDSPIDEWYAGPLRPIVDDLLRGLPFDPPKAVIDEIVRPKWAEEQFRQRISLSHHAFQVIGLLSSYGAFARHAP